MRLLFILLMLSIGTPAHAKGSQDNFAACESAVSAIAIEACTILLESDQLSDLDRSWVFRERAVEYVKIGRFVESVSDFENSIDLDSTSPWSYNGLAWILLTEREIHDPARALELARATVAILDNWNTRDTLAMAYAELGRSEDALREYEIAFDQNWDYGTSVQELLRGYGYYSGPVNGMWSEETRNAVLDCIRDGRQINIFPS